MDPPTDKAAPRNFFATFLDVGELARSRFTRNIVRIATSTAASQAIVLAAMPLMARLYGPEAFGALAVFTAVQVIAACVFTLKYELSIILPRDAEKASELTVLTLATSLAFSVLFAVAMVAARLFLDSPPALHYLLLPVGTFLTALYTSAQMWSARANDYRRYARAQVINAFVNVASAVSLAVFASSSSGHLVLAYVAGLTVASAYLAYGVDVRGRSVSALLRSLIPTAREYGHFPLFVLPSALLATLALSAQPFLLQILFSLSEVGLYAIASRFLLIPAGLVGGAISEAFRAELVDRLRRDLKITNFLQRTLLKLLLIALPVFVASFAVAPDLFAVLFGETYRHSGVLARYVCLGAFGQFVTQPFGYVFVGTGRVKLGLVLQAGVTLLPLTGLVLGGIYWDIERALLFWSIAVVASSTVMVILARRCCKQRDDAYR